MGSLKNWHSKPINSVRVVVFQFIDRFHKPISSMKENILHHRSLAFPSDLISKDTRWLLAYDRFAGPLLVVADAFVPLRFASTAISTIAILGQ